MLLIPFLHHYSQTTLSAQADHRRRSWPGLRLLALFLTITLGLGLIQPALAALVWQIQTVDSAGNVGFDSSLELDSSGRPVISYFDFSNFNLKLVRCGDATCSSGNTIVTVDSAGNVGLYASLVLDSSGNPVISYYDGTNGDLKLVRCGDATCSSGNTFQIVDSSGDVGQFTSLRLDSSDRPVISYFDVTNLDLKLVRCGNTTCSSGNTIQTLDSAGVVGRDPSLVLDGSGRPVISYYDISNDDLKLVRCITICSIIQTVDSAGDVGQHNSLVLDSSGRPVISYTDDINGDLKLVHCGNTTCSSGNTIVIVENATNSGRDTSLVLDSSGKPIISYYDAFNGDLKLVQCGDATCSSGNTFQIVDSAGTVGGYTSLALDSSGKPVISYYDYTNSNLKVARLIDNSPPPSVTVNQAAGQADPANSNPVLFSASFSQDVTGFSAADITLSGTANLAGASVTVSGGPRDYTISVSGVAGNGTIVASIAAGVASNAAGKLNTASTSTDNAVYFDSTPPVITSSLTPATPNGQNGWYVSDVTVSFTCADEAGGSGLATNTVAGATLTADGANQSVTNTGVCIDNAGNVATAVTVSPINIDLTPPVVAVTGVTNGASYTLGSVPPAGCDTQDATSGVATSATLSISGGNGDGTGVFIATCDGATDLAANSGSASVSYTVAPLPDSTPPVITPQIDGVLGNNGWYVSGVTVSWSVVDNESAISNQNGCDPVGVTTDTGGATFTCSATSLGGSSSQSVTIQRDATPPVVNVTGVSDGATYTAGSVPPAGCSTSDATSDVATQSTLNVSGGNGDGTGSFTATCSGAMDNAGNGATLVSISYTVTAAPPPPLRQQVESVRDNLVTLLPSGDSKTDKALQKALSKLDQALAANLWQADGNHLTLLGDDVFNRLYDAVKELAKIKNPAPAIGSASSSLVTISRALAQLALDEAIAGGGDAGKIAQAQSKLGKGDGEVAKGKLAKAIAQYEDAWEYAQQALGIPVAAGLDPAADEPTLEDESDTDAASDPEVLPFRLFLPVVNR